MSRAKSRRNLDYTEVLEKLAEKGISIRVASPKLVMEEAPESYKNVTDVVDTCTLSCFYTRPVVCLLKRADGRFLLVVASNHLTAFRTAAARLNRLVNFM